MDSQENALEMGKTEDVKNVVETVDTVAGNAMEEATDQVDNASEGTVAPVEETFRKVYTTKKEVLERVKEIAQRRTSRKGGNRPAEDGFLQNAHSRT